MSLRHSVGQVEIVLVVGILDTALYGENRYNTKESEETEESAPQSFSVPYSYPFGPKFKKLNYIIQNYSRYLNLLN